MIKIKENKQIKILINNSKTHKSNWNNKIKLTRVNKIPNIY